MIRITNKEEFKKDIALRMKAIGDEESEEYLECFFQEINNYINSEIINNLIQEKDKNHIRIELSEEKGVNAKESSLILRGHDNEVLLIIDAYSYESECQHAFEYGYKLVGFKYFYESLKDNILEINYCVINKNKLLFFRNKISEIKDIEKAQVVFYRISYYTRKYMVYLGNKKYAGIKLCINEITSLANIPKSFLDVFSIMHYVFTDEFEFKCFLEEISIGKNKDARNIILYKIYYENLNNIGFKNEKQLSIFLDLLDKVKKINNKLKIEHAFKVYSPFDENISNYVLIIIYLRTKNLKTGKKGWSDNYLSFKLQIDDKLESIPEKQLYILYPDFKELDGITVNDYINNRSEVHRLINLMNY